jgi:LPXTG-motif cell wall-anchored protein
MKKFTLVASIVAVSALMAVAAVAFTSKNADAASSNCKVEVIGDKNTANDKNSKFTKNGRQVTAKVKVTGNNCKEDVALAAFKAPEGNRPLSAQRLHNVTKRTFNSGTHEISVEVPNCYFQADLVTGHDVATKNGTPLDFHGRLMGWLVGGQNKCEMPTTACDSLAVTKLSRTNFRMTGHATIENGAGVRAYIFTITRNGKVVGKPQDIRTHEDTASFVYAQTTPGTYHVSLTVLTSEGDKTSPACNGSFTVVPPTPGKIEVCEISTGKIVEINQDQLSDKYTTDLSKCIPGTPQTPETPGALPNTGAGSVVAIFTGVTSLSSAAYYFISRRFA